jgi:hypothetical protein
LFGVLTAGRHGASIRRETDAGFLSETQLSVDAGQHELQIATLRRGVSKLLLSERTAKHASTYLIICDASVPKPEVVD